jgi:hypothetical protein
MFEFVCRENLSTLSGQEPVELKKSAPSVLAFESRIEKVDALSHRRERKEKVQKNQNKSDGSQEFTQRTELDSK